MHPDTWFAVRSVLGGGEASERRLAGETEEISIVMTLPPNPRPTPYRQTAEAVLAALGSDAKRGLATAEATARLQRDGRNELTAQAPVPLWRKFLAQFTDVLVILLIVAGLVSAAIWWFERGSS